MTMAIHVSDLVKGGKNEGLCSHVSLTCSKRDFNVIPQRILFFI